MTSIVHQLTTLYTQIDDFLKAHPAQANWRRSNHRAPAFSDAEVLTIGLMQGHLGVATLKQTYRLIAHNFRDAFPRLPTYAQWLARLHALAPLVGELIVRVCPPLDTFARLYICDSKPLPVCKPLRHGKVRLLREDGAYYGKNKAGWFFGFKLHALVYHTGFVLGAMRVPGNHHDSTLAPALALCIAGAGGVALCDRAYDHPEVETFFDAEADLLLVTPRDAPKETRPLLSAVRERVETVLSQLAERFVDRVRSRSFLGLWSATRLKILHLNLWYRERLLTQAGVIDQWATQY